MQWPLHLYELLKKLFYATLVSIEYIVFVVLI